ncbi:hypothetical protein PAPYR_2420 [Paratrimastix pyriformis]|uniref:Uncharacterized protein n=1 Tax=Paratrimastix pyriformis TaxID=342808 RepID=A0ABQ8UQC5_9EUKA|nr:hypothetical protein PAPYR_2420 [Paratrimastix pyriformis]
MHSAQPTEFQEIVIAFAISGLGFLAYHLFFSLCEKHHRSKLSKPIVESPPLDGNPPSVSVKVIVEGDCKWENVLVDAPGDGDMETRARSIRHRTRIPASAAAIWGRADGDPVHVLGSPQDQSGGERSNWARQYYRAQVALICFDLNDPCGLESARRAHRSLLLGVNRSGGPRPVMVLVGLKGDLDHRVSLSAIGANGRSPPVALLVCWGHGVGGSLCAELGGLEAFLVSAKTGDGAPELLEYITRTTVEGNRSLFRG